MSRPDGAIFHLEGEARLATLPSLPLEAVWTKYAGVPRWGNFDEIKHDRRGLVWQAEERDENGKPQRYYGFVGFHIIARVPAEEIDFPSDLEDDFVPVSDELEFMLEPPDLDLADPNVARGAVLSVRNPRGITIDAPAALNDPTARREDITFRLRHASFPKEGETWPDRATDVGWILQEPRLTPTQPGPMPAPLAPAESRPILSIDVRNMFEIGDPGLYILEVHIKGVPLRNGSWFGQMSTEFVIP